MSKTSFTFYRGYVDNEVWTTDLANEWKHIPISEDLIETAKKIVYEKGVRVKIIDPKNLRLPEDYLFQGNLIRINPFLTCNKPAPLCGPDIELHSETDEGLEKLIKDLGLPDK